MLTIAGGKEPPSSFCDGISRRSAIKIGSLGLTGLTLPRLLAAEAKAKPSKPKKRKSK